MNENLIDQYNQKDMTGAIGISRIDNLGIALYFYKYGSGIGMGSSISVIGKHSLLYRLFGIENNSIIDVINNFDQIKQAINQLPENVTTITAWTSSAEDYWNSKNNLFYYYNNYLNEEMRIGKVTLEEIDLNKLNEDQSFYFYDPNSSCKRNENLIRCISQDNILHLLREMI